MKKVLGLGNALVDILVRIDDDALLASLDLPKSCMTLVREEQVNAILDKISHPERQEACGGSAANTISGLARLGVPTGYIGKIGCDRYGEFFAAEMGRHGTLARLFHRCRRRPGGPWPSSLPTRSAPSPPFWARQWSWRPPTCRRAVPRLRLFPYRGLHGAEPFSGRNGPAPGQGGRGWWCRSIWPATTWCART